MVVGLTNKIMKILGLDLSTVNTGWAIYDGEVCKYGSIPIESRLTFFEKVRYIIKEIDKVVKEHKPVELAIEDTYFGLNQQGFKVLTRLSGAVMYYWYLRKHKVCKFLLATQARKEIGLTGNATKAEVQVFIAKKFGYVTVKQAQKLENKIEDIRQEKIDGSLSANRAKYVLKKVSQEIGREYDLNDDQADAIAVAMAYYKIIMRR